MNDVTVAICAYNAAKYIEETLKCIVNQTFQRFDLLIINDCSLDNTRELIIKFFYKYPRQYNLINFELNKGLAAGRHYVERIVNTKYILFIDADDCPYPTLIEKLYYKIASDDDLMAVGCYHEFIDSYGNKIVGGIFLGETSKKKFYYKAQQNKLIFMPLTAIINRELLLSVGGRNIHGFFDGKPRYQDLCEDLDLWTRMSDLYVNGKAIVVIPEILCKYRKHEQAMTSNSLGMILRMRHIKSNLLRRRAGEPEMTFVDFYNSISAKEMTAFKRKSSAADYLRNGVFLARKRNFIGAARNILQSFWLDPSYIFQKISSNSGFFK